MKTLVTGASGKLGPFVARELASAGHEVVISSRREPGAELTAKWQWIQADIASFDDCMKATEGGIEAIHHVGAQPNPTDNPGRDGGGFTRPGFDTTMKTNIMGTYYLLRAALERGIKIFVMTGSNCALGHGFRISGRPFPFKYLPVDEKHPTDVEDSYSFSKLAGERLLESYTKAYGMRTHVVRACGICDEGRRKAMAEHASPSKRWSEWLWAWVGSEDVASAHRLLMEKADEIAPHGVYFCNADDTSALEPTRELIERTRPDLAPLMKDLEGHASIESAQALKEAVGWEHRTSWREHLTAD
ncbi:MAG: NAD-dependent epimerase/dehydratase family protein [Planctomycetota bacterium]|jgi:UDP-glucose 4-epimerase